MIMKNDRQCLRCGTCCGKGGPALHPGDLDLLERATLSLPDLITIRKGEPAFNPFTETVEPAVVEFVKIAGKGADWECRFYDPAGSACIIHSDRPLECRLLKCWDVGQLQAISGKECLSRFDLIGKDDPLRPHIITQEEKCSYTKINLLLDKIADPAGSGVEGLKAVIQEDLAIRQQAITLFDLTLSLELFYFGRPLFKVLQ